MSYTYPDRQDRLTCQLIETEYDGAYWGKSEDAVLSRACDLIHNLRKTGHACWSEKELRLLDAGCGLGRLFSVFADAGVDTITAVEPDQQRFAEAAKEADRVTGKSSCRVQALYGDCSVLPEQSSFQIVLSSHVLQHITRAMAEALMEEMSRRLQPGGLFILTTTCTDNTDDLFFRESWRNGERHEEPIDGTAFDETFGMPDVLPVRIFASDTVKEMAARHGLSFREVLAYHYKDHHQPEEDRQANDAGRLAGARDAMYLFTKDAHEKPDETIDANICYHFSFSIFDEEIGLRTDDEEELRAAVRKAYPDAVFQDDEEALREPLFRDLKTGQEFLHGGGLPFSCFRVLLKGYDLQFKDYDVTDSAVFMTVFSESDTVQMCVCLSVKNAGIDDYVYFRHVQGNGAKLRNADGRMLSVKEIFQEASGCLKRNITDIEETYLIEIKRWGGYENTDNVASIIDRKTRPVYGIMTGDEGWRHVPEALAKARMENSWGSRNFIRLVSFGANSVFFNLYQNCHAADYRENRRRFDAAYYGGMNPYFLMDSPVAGINHGILFSMELVMVIKTICNRILRRQASYYIGGQGSQLHGEIRKLKAYRGELITTLNKVENLQISEIGELEKVLLVSQQIEPIIEKIKYLLELLESELDLIYQTSTNRLVNFLTVMGLILAGIQVLLALL